MIMRIRSHMKARFEPGFPSMWVLQFSYWHWVLTSGRQTVRSLAFDEPQPLQAVEKALYFRLFFDLDLYDAPIYCVLSPFCVEDIG